MGSDGAAGRPWGLDEADGWPWRVRGHTVESRRVRHRDYKPRAALEGTHFFWRKLTYPRNCPIFLVYYNSPNGYAHSNCIEILCKVVWSMPKVTLPMPKPIMMRHHR